MFFHRYLTSLSGPEVKNWFINSDFHNSSYSALFLNDVLNYVFVKKYGGTALNFDILLLRHSINCRMVSSVPFVYFRELV